MPEPVEDKATTLSKDDIEEIIKILLQLNSVVKSSQLYLLDSSLIEEFNVRLLAILQKQMEKRGDIKLRFIGTKANATKALFNDIELYEISGIAPGFVRACLERQVQSITFSRGLSMNEFTEFIKIMAMSPEELGERDGMRAELLSRNISHIVVEDLADLEHKMDTSDDAEGEDAAAQASGCYDQLEVTRALVRGLQEEMEIAEEQMKLLLESIKGLEKTSITDALTGLYNQRHFHDSLEQAVTRNKRQKHPLCLLFFDVDGLKIYNDNYGHLVGNDVLRAVAKSLSQSIRKNVDSGYRCGGDEFAAILPEVNAEQAVEIAMRVNRNFRKKGFQYVSLSFGVAELGPETDSKTLFKHADDAMYMAKRRMGVKSNVSNVSKDKICIYSKEGQVR